jgi:type IV pilus assembly protein PilA
MAKSNGFASAQLLGIIAVLGIISLMAIYTVTGMTNSNYEKKYQINLQTMKQAAKSYLDKSSVKITDGEKKIFTIKTLKDAGIMAEVLDPKNNNECDGYVTVTSNNGEYLFMPYLKCQGNYISNDYVEVDTIKPVLALVGNSKITINKGESYSDEGATAIDDVDGDK